MTMLACVLIIGACLAIGAAARDPWLALLFVGLILWWWWW